MADPWVSLLIGGTLLLVGFAASLAFERYRIPDFFVLILLGVVLAHIPVAPFGPSLLPSLEPILPVFVALTLAFIMVEGGLSLSLSESGSVGAILVHVLGAMALTMVLTWFLATRLLGLSDLTGLVLAAAFSGPSATIVMGFAPQLRLGPEALNAILLEGVLGNVAAAVVVLYVLGTPGAGIEQALLPYLARVAFAASFAFVVGLGWRIATRRIARQRFVYMATVALAVVLYAASDGLMDRSGAVAAFVFGLVLAYHRPGIAAVAAPKPAEGLRAFQGEITFVLRTFFFVYLGLTMSFERFSLTALGGALLLTGGFIVARVPSSLALGRVLVLRDRETRVLLSTVARGMTDVVLVLLALSSGILPASEGDFLLGMLPLVILVAAIACASLLIWSERADGKRAEPAAATPAAPDRGA